MQRENRLLIVVKMYADLLFITAIIFFLQVSGTQLTQNFISLTTLFNVLACTFFWHIIARSFGLYADLMYKPFSIEWVRFMKTYAVYVMATSFSFFQLLDDQFFNRRHFLIYCGMVLLLLPLQKLVTRLVVKRIFKQNRFQRNVLIVGAGSTGLNFYNEYVAPQKHGWRLTGFVDDELQPSLNGHYLGQVADIERVIHRHNPDDIFVTLPAHHEKQIKHVVAIGQREGKRVKLIPDFQHLGGGRMQVDSLGNLSVINLNTLPLDSIDTRFFKRAFDIVFSVLVIVAVFSWLFPIIALLIKITSKGPVFFVQDRWGLDNKVIRCFKFRTMVAGNNDVDEKGAYRQASRNDCRITPVGCFLRKTSLDELPQFFNVLLGSMSVIGPRPHPVPLNMESKDSVEKYMMRHWVKPGISGWAQVHGFRGETRDPDLMKARVRHDLWYIENWTFWLDQQIIVQTLVNMVKGEKNAF